MTCLLLSFWHLFNEDPGHCTPACECVSTLDLGASCTLSNPESHSHLSFVNVITVTFNVAVTEKIMLPSSLHVECTVNRPRRAALGAIELEVPATTATFTVINPQVTSKVDMEGSVCVLLHEFTVLLKKMVLNECELGIKTIMSARGTDKDTKLEIARFIRVFLFSSQGSKGTTRNALFIMK